MASAARHVYTLFGPGGGKALVAPKETSRACIDALDLGGATFDVRSMSGLPWVPFSFGQHGDGVYRAVFVQLDPDADERVPYPRIVFRIGDKEGSGAAKEAFGAMAPKRPEGGKPGKVRLVEASSFLEVAAAAHKAGRMAISPESVRSAHVCVVDMYM